MAIFYVKIENGSNYVLESALSSFPSGGGFFEVTSSMYFPSIIPYGLVVI